MDKPHEIITPHPKDLEFTRSEVDGQAAPVLKVTQEQSSFPKGYC